MRIEPDLSAFGTPVFGTSSFTGVHHVAGMHDSNYQIAGMQYRVAGLGAAGDAIESDQGLTPDILAAGVFEDDAGDLKPKYRWGTYIALALLGGLSGYFLMRESSPKTGALGGAVLAAGVVVGTDLYLTGVQASREILMPSDG